MHRYWQGAFFNMAQEHTMSDSTMYYFSATGKSLRAARAVDGNLGGVNL
jgi:hypothetical protein